MVNPFIRKIVESMPGLKTRLIMAQMPDTPEIWIRKSLMTALVLSFGFFVLFLGGIFSSIGISLIYVFFLFPIGFIFFFSFIMRYPEMQIKRLEKGINKEIIFATRFLIIELESGVPLYQVFKNLIPLYPNTGTYFRSIVDKVHLGTMMEEALIDTTAIVPSNNLRKILWQMLNSIKTGTEIHDSLGSVVSQIIKEQKIAFDEYGKKLNPLAMFYMLIAVIAPSLGITMLVIFSSFIGFRLTLPILLTLAGFLIFMQFMFLGMIRSSRPALEF